MEISPTQYDDIANITFSSTSSINHENTNSCTFDDECNSLNKTSDFLSNDLPQYLPNKHSFYSNEMESFNQQDSSFRQQSWYAGENETYYQQNDQPQFQSNQLSNEHIQSDSNQCTLDSQKDNQSPTQNRADTEIKQFDKGYDQPVTQRKGKKRGPPFKGIKNQNIKLPNKKIHSTKNVKRIARLFRKLISIDKYSLREEVVLKIRNNFNDDTQKKIEKIEYDLMYCKTTVMENKVYVRDFKKKPVTVTKDNISVLGKLCYQYKFQDEIEFFEDPVYNFLFGDCLQSMEKEFQGQVDVLKTLESLKLRIRN
ncbi:UNKNOWN [Stylonychia lemnae]|uniref:Uncharacterized protein n=1 Tax=Stylonychia lemnae TaxID=5949 RepID=A0A078B8Q1_STYLE|nr:UNKNOWN [Stylonychia lemnae]|eukprot:CDW90596.1 UNKNOWN [Stylonychia lemnae]